MSSQIVTYEVDDATTVSFEIDAMPGFRSAGAKEVLGRVQRAVGPAIDAAKVVLDRSKAVQPDRVELKFGVKVSGDANWLVAKAASEGNFEITLTWERLRVPHPDDVLIEAADKGRGEAILAGGQPLAVIGGEDDPG